MPGEEPQAPAHARRGSENEVAVFPRKHIASRSGDLCRPGAPARNRVPHARAASIDPDPAHRWQTGEGDVSPVSLRPP